MDSYFYLIVSGTLFTELFCYPVTYAIEVGAILSFQQRVWTKFIKPPVTLISEWLIKGLYLEDSIYMSLSDNGYK